MGKDYDQEMWAEEKTRYSNSVKRAKPRDSGFH